MSAENENLSKHLQTHCGEAWRCWNSKGKHFIGANYKVSYDTKKSGSIRKHIPVSVSQQFLLLIKLKLNQLFFFSHTCDRCSFIFIFLYKLHSQTKIDFSEIISTTVIHQQI